MDTAEKRRAAAALPFQPVGVTPNVDKDAEWRQQAGWGYSGISASADEGADDSWLHLIVRRKQYVLLR